jgi:hypothetical protein
MLEKIRGSYARIAKHIPELKGLISAPARSPSSSAHNKQLLLEMARAGEPMPKPKKHPLGYCFRSYTREHSKCYDPSFVKEIKRLAPHWLVSSSQRKKTLLLDMANKGFPKLTHKHPLFEAFYSYVSKSSDCYDPAFVKEIRRVAPHWLVSSSKQKKSLLIKMAKRKNSIPPLRRSHLGSAFDRYTKQNSMSYDPVFTAKIRKLAPHWFKRSNKPSHN